MLAFLRRALDRRAYDRTLLTLTALLREERMAEAEVQAEDALAIAERAFGDDAIELTTPLYVLAAARLSRGNVDDALAPCSRAIAIAEAHAGQPTEPRLPKLHELAAAIHERAGRLDEATRVLRKLLSGHERMRAPDEATIADLSTRIGLLLARTTQTQTGEAELLLRRALTITERVAGARSRAAAEALYNLGTVLATTGQRDEATRALTRAIDLLDRDPPLDPDLLEKARRNLDAAKSGRMPPPGR